MSQLDDQIREVSCSPETRNVTIDDMMLKVGLSPKLKNLPVDKLIGSTRSCEQSSSFKQPKGANRSLVLGNSFIDSLMLSPQAGKDDFNDR